MRHSTVVLLFAAFLAAGGCASGAKYRDVAEKLPVPAADHGRIFFYRSGSIFGAAVQPTVYLNGEAVGTSVPGGFFFVDRPAGSFEASCSTEVEHSASFTLGANESRFLKSYVTFGLVVGRAHLELVPNDEAVEEIGSASYTGSIPLAAEEATP